ncbi:MAG: hypothetical protein ABR926_24750 [Streptosporangiaceae bacterium]
MDATTSPGDLGGPHSNQQESRGLAMTRRQRNELVTAHADLILADEPAVEAYTLHFEAQMRRGKVWRLLSASWVHFAWPGAILFGLDAREIQ